MCSVASFNSTFLRDSHVCWKKYSRVVDVARVLVSSVPSPSPARRNGLEWGKNIGQRGHMHGRGARAQPQYGPDAWALDIIAQGHEERRQERQVRAAAREPFAGWVDRSTNGLNK